MSERFVNLNVRKSTRERAIKIKDAHGFKNQDELVNKSFDLLDHLIKGAENATNDQKENGDV